MNKNENRLKRLHRQNKCSLTCASSTWAKLSPIYKLPPTETRCKRDWESKKDMKTGRIIREAKKFCCLSFLLLKAMSSGDVVFLYWWSGRERCGPHSSTFNTQVQISILNLVCKITHHVWNKNYIHDYTGVCRVQYGKNSSHLKNFTLTSLLALVTIIRYALTNTISNLILHFQNCISRFFCHYLLTQVIKSFTTVSHWRRLSTTQLTAHCQFP